MNSTEETTISNPIPEDTPVSEKTLRREEKETFAEKRQNKHASSGDDGYHNVFAINFGKENNEGTPDVQEFIYRWANRHVFVHQLMIHNRFPAETRKTLFPTIYYVTLWLFFAAALLCFGAYGAIVEQQRHPEWNLPVTDKDALSFIIGGSICAGVFLLLGLIYIIRKVSFHKRLPLTDVDASKSFQLSRRRTLFKVPRKSVTMDVIMYPYRLDRKGKEVNYTRMTPIRYQNMGVDAYLDNGQVFLVNYCYSISFDLKKIVKIEPMNHRFTFSGWNKLSQPDAEKFGHQHLRWNDFGDFESDVIRLIVQGEKEQYEILFPAYEEETLTRLLQGDKIDKE